MPRQFTNGYALLIGVDQNSVEEWALPDVSKDIRALTQVLTHPGRCAYPADNLKLLTGREATRQGILDGLAWLHARLQADTSGNATVIVYYTGHGWRDESLEPPQFYLIPYDISQEQVRSRALRATDFADAVEELKPQRLLAVLDCCHAAGMGLKDLRLGLPVGYARSAIFPPQLVAGEKALLGPGAKGLETLALGKGRAVLSSSTGDQPSYLRRDGTMSIFTYHLIQALTGHAQPQEGATEVLVSDLMSHVWRHVPHSAQADWGADQTPDYQVSGNFPVALLLGGKGLARGQPAPDPLEDVAAEKPSPPVQIDTGGGAYIGGSVTVGGNFVGRDQIHISDSTGVAVGPGAQASVTQGLGGDELARLFAAIYQQIEARPEAPDVDKEELADTVQKIQAEVARGEQANPNKVERWLGNLAKMAPDILDVTLACLTNPAVGIAAVISKIAEKAKAEAGSAT